MHLAPKATNPSHKVLCHVLPDVLGVLCWYVGNGSTNIMFHVSILDSLSLFGVTPLLSLTVLLSAANALMTSLPPALRGWVLQCVMCLIWHTNTHTHLFPGNSEFCLNGFWLCGAYRTCVMCMSASSCCLGILGLCQQHSGMRRLQPQHTSR